MKRRLVAALLASALGGCQARDDTRRPPASTEPTTRSAETSPHVTLEPLDPRPRDCVTHELTAATVHVVPLELTAGDFLHLSFEQRGIDLVIRLVESQRRPLSFDSPAGSKGVEHVVFVADDTVDLRVEIGAWRPDSEGAYRVCVEARRPATSRDRSWAAAVRAYYDARYGEDLASDTRVARYRQAAELASDVDEPAFEAQALVSLADLELRRNRPRSAIEVLGQALDVRRRLDDLEGQARVHDLLGTARLALGEHTHSRQAYELALDAWRRLGDLKGEAGALSNLGLVAKREDRYRLAFERYQEAMVLWQRIGERCDLATTHNNLGTFYDLFDERSRAWDHFRQAESLLGRCDNETVVARTLPIVLTKMGDLLADEGEIDEALEQYRRALDLRRRSGDRSGEAVTLNSIALVSGSRDPRAAFAAFRSALGIFRELGQDAYRSTVLRNLAALHERVGDLQEARRSYEAALELASRSGNDDAQARAQLGLAGLAEGAGDLEEAERRARRAVDLVDARHGAIARNDLRVSYLAHRQSYFDLLIAVLAQRHRREPGEGFADRAFAVADAARARELLDLVTFGPAPSPDAALDALGAEINASHREWLKASQAAKPTHLKPAEIDLRWLLAKHHELSGRDRARPDLALPGLDRVRQELLDDDTFVLAYHLADTRGWLWAVTESGTSLHEIEAGRSRVEAAVAKVLASDLRHPRAAAAALRRLTDLLIAPIARQLDRPRLVVTGPGIVQALPWAALPHPTTGEPLGLDREIVHLPSIAVLEALRARAARRHAGSAVAIVANAVYGPDDPRLPRPLAATPPEPPWLDPLPASLVEARAAARWLGSESRIFEGFQATRELLAEGRLASLRVLHLATHTLLDVPDAGRADNEPRTSDALPVVEAADLAALVFSRFDAGGRTVDGYLRAYEIRRLELDVDLVVLSACRSVLGEDVGGEGLVGLTHAFLAAGARGVVASLWDVDDRATAELMDRFYRGLSHGLAPSRALSRAQAQMRREEEWRAPHFWAGFAFYGDAPPSEKKELDRAAVARAAAVGPALH